MKTFTLATLLLAIALSTAACGHRGPLVAPAPTPEQPTEAATP